MRSDLGQSDNFEDHSSWGNVEFALFRPTKESGASFRSTAFSGNERNRLFMKLDHSFVDASLVSNVDFTEDGRGFALLDYDKDGWVDMALASPNNPRLRIVRNRLGSLPGDNKSFTIELVGGNVTAKPTMDWSAKDPFGATVVVTINGDSRKFQLSCGEGLSSQNEKRIRVGIADSTTAEKIEVSWPSGKRTVLENIDLRDGTVRILERSKVQE